MIPANAPSDATFFKAGGKDYFLYLGCVELQTIQREWGLAQEAGDTTAKMVDKQFTFNFRLEGRLHEDIFHVLQAALGRWARATRTELNEEVVADILAGLEPQPQNPKARGYKRAELLYQRLIFDCLGKEAPKEEDEDEAPKEKAGEEASTPLIS
jgi:hypothetical protein